MRYPILPDDLIIKGFQQFDARITKEFFYAYCRKAYSICDYKYQLRSKVGLDFYSLAHEYYIQLLQHEFRQLTDRPEGIPLATWMAGGFRYVVLEALKAYNTEVETLVDAAADEVVEYVRSAETDDSMLHDVTEAVCQHYHDRTMQEIAHMVFYEGFKQKEVADYLGITPAAVNQRYKKMMDEVVTPFVVANYGQGVSFGQPAMPASPSMPCETSHATPARPAPSQAQPQVPASKSRSMFPSMLGFVANDFISSPQEEILVFGSNLQGMHVGGAAREARLSYGAIMGQGKGLQGRSYAIPTMQGGVETIRPYVDEFIAFAKAHRYLYFRVTPIGCGIAGFEPEDIAPLFAAAQHEDNISLPVAFVRVLNR